MKHFLPILFIWFLITFQSFAQSPPIGKLSLSDKSLTLANTKLPLYNVFNQDYIPLFILQDFGYQVGFNVHSNTIVTYKPTSSLLNKKIESDSYWSSNSLTDAPYHLFEGIIYIQNFNTHGIIANGRALVPIEALSSLGTLHTTDSGYSLTHADPLPFTATNLTIQNWTNLDTTLLVMDIYWNGKWVTKSTSYHLTPYGNISRPPLDDSMLYVSSIITSVINEKVTFHTSHLLGQLNTSLFALHDRVINLQDLSTFGDPLSVAEIFLAEDTIRNMNLSSDTPYLIWTDLQSQKTYIFENKNNQWHLLKHFICSTGKSSSPTPSGTYKLTKKVPYFGVEKGYRCKNAFGFIGTTYLYHSVMYDVTGTYVLEGNGNLGTPASAGCIRLSPENSLWLYNNMLPGTTVYIK